MVTFEEGPKIDTCLTRAFLDACQLAKRMLTTLEEHGAIERRPAADDKRSHTLVLTPYGQELYDVHVAQFHEHLTELFDDIPERDICVMVSVIEKTWELLSNDDFKLTLSNSKEV